VGLKHDGHHLFCDREDTMHPHVAPRIITAVWLLLAATFPAFAIGPGHELRSAFGEIAPGMVESGRLLDRTVPLAGLLQLDGRAGAPAVTPSQWRQALHELRLASFAAPAWPSAGVIRARTADLADRGLVPVAILDLAHERLRPDALDDGFLRMEAGRFVADPGAPAAELVISGRAVAATALVSTIHRGRNARFVVPEDLLIADEPVTLAADFGDGLGLRLLTPGTPVSVNYAATGRHEVRLRLTGEDGAMRWSRFQVDVAALDVPEPTAVWPLTASEAYGGATATGEAFVYLADGHTEVTDPVVVVEGFDLDDSMDWPELYTLLNQANLLEDLRANGRDAVILNFGQPTDPIQRNAFLLVELLQTVDGLLEGNTNYPVVGASMGGLVTRYALAWMEHENLDHHCDLFIAFDSPQAGANIPLGQQIWLDFFSSESDEAAYLLDRLGTPAARQMLLYHHTALDGSHAGPSPLFQGLRSDLSGIGDWPAQPRLVAVANGSGLGTDQGFSPAAQLIDYEYGSLLVDIIGNVWAVPDGSSQAVFDGLIDLIWPLPDTQRTVTVNGTLPWDGAPGGYRSSLAEMDATSVPYGDVIALHDNHAFIPTVAALAMTGAQPFADLTSLDQFPPFDAVYMPAENEEHVAVTEVSRGWILDEILGDLTAVAQDDHRHEPSLLRLHGAAPNPFNPRTEISFALPTSGDVRLWIVDLRGRHVRTLVTDRLPVGDHRVTWDGRDQAGHGASAGVYLAVVEHAGQRLAKRVTLVR